MNGDPEVMRFLSAADPDEQSVRFAAHWDEHGFGLWALRLRDSDEVLGFAGLSVPAHVPEVLPAVEVGWRLRRGAWGCGYATEAGRAALERAWSDLGLDEVISIIHPDNERSLAVARRLGLAERERVRELAVLAQRRPVSRDAR